MSASIYTVAGVATLGVNHASCRITSRKTCWIGDEGAVPLHVWLVVVTYGKPALCSMCVPHPVRKGNLTTSYTPRPLLFIKFPSPPPLPPPPPSPNHHDLHQYHHHHHHQRDRGVNFFTSFFSDPGSLARLTPLFFCGPALCFSFFCVHDTGPWNEKSRCTKQIA